MCDAEGQPSVGALPVLVFSAELRDRPLPEADDVLRALRGRGRELVEWPQVVRLLARQEALDLAEAEAILTRALRDPRRLFVGLLSRKTGKFFIRSTGAPP